MMFEMDVTIREASAEDCERLGEVHVRAWQVAYRSVMPDAYLDSLDPSEREDMWRRVIDRDGSDGLLVATSGGEPVGFASFGPAREQPAGTGELYALNLDPDHWGRGIGRQLLREATSRLSSGFGDLILWVVPENVRARTLYESEGWSADGTTKTDEVMGVTVAEILYRRPI